MCRRLRQQAGSYTGTVPFTDFMFTEIPCRSWLASEGGLSVTTFTGSAAVFVSDH
jgi:hypothetical protein